MHFQINIVGIIDFKSLTKWRQFYSLPLLDGSAVVVVVDVVVVVVVVGVNLMALLSNLCPLCHKLYHKLGLYFY